jgi:hypothetical protein
VQIFQFTVAPKLPFSGNPRPNLPHSVPCQALFLFHSLQPIDSTPDRGSQKTPVFTLFFAILKLGKDIAASSASAFRRSFIESLSLAPTRFLSNFCREI